MYLIHSLLITVTYTPYTGPHQKLSEQSMEILGGYVHVGKVGTCWSWQPLVIILTTHVCPDGHVATCGPSRLGFSIPLFVRISCTYLKVTNVTRLGYVRIQYEFTRSVVILQT